MSSDAGETRRVSTRPHGAGAAVVGTPEAEQEQLPCPRCSSTNTKFCYYNNYNFSQPRHFCKSCRRYWTRGGTLRDIPVGGGSRKSAKRSRVSSTPSAAAAPAMTVVTPSACSTAVSRTTMLPATPVFLAGSAVRFGGGEVKGGALSLCGSFMGLGRFGLGLGSGFEEVGFGLGKAIRPFSGVGDGTASLSSKGGPAAQVLNMWQLENIENSSGFVAAGDCFEWPDLAISTPGNTLK